MASPASLDQELLTSLRERTTAAAQSWVPGAEAIEVRPLTGGSSSLTFTAVLAGVPAENRTVVLKVAPPGLMPVRNRDVLRQGTLMRALSGHPGVVVPSSLFEDGGDPPAVSPFLAMNLVPGECREPVLTPSAERDPATFADIRQRAFEAAHILAAMHALDPKAIGLGEEPVVTLGAEIDRWSRALETVTDDLRGNCAEVAQALHDTMPPPLPPVVNHGDYRLGNMLCAGPSVNSVIDWEIWSVGDPRVDVTWMTYFCDDQSHPGAPDDAGPSGMPTTDELTAVYEEALGAALPDLDWFKALTRYKETAATALLIKRARKAGQVDDLSARMTPALPVMLDEAMVLLGR